MSRLVVLGVLPLAGAAFVAAMLLGPGQQRPVRAAKVLAVADSDGHIRSLRVLTVLRGELAEQPSAQAGLSLTAHDGTLSWEGESGPDGTAEVRLSRPLKVGESLRVQQHGEVIAQGELVLPTAEAPKMAPATIASSKEGGVRITLRAPRGMYVPSVPDELLVMMTDAQGKPAFGTIELISTGIEPATIKLDVTQVITTIPITVVSPPATLVATGRSGVDLEGKVRAELPTTMGVIGLAPQSSAGRLTFVSPAPRDAAHISMFDRQGRVGGARVPLREDPDGFFRGHLWDTDVQDFAGLVVASDAYESTTAAWPAPGRTGEFSAPRLAVGLDGTKGQLALERRRLRLIRTLTFGVVALTTALEIVLLLWDAKRGSKLGPEVPQRDSRSLLLVGVALVVLVGVAVVGLALGH